MTGLLAVVATCFATPGLLVPFSLAFIHGIVCMLTFLLPIILSLRGDVQAGFALVGWCCKRMLEKQPL